MNSVNLIGNLTRDPQIAYTAESQSCIARFSIAINRGKNRNGEDLGADFPSIVAYGKTAEIVDKYVHKGNKVGIIGRVRTGSYEKDGSTVYFTEIVADKIELLTPREADRAAADDFPQREPAGRATAGEGMQETIPGFSKLDDDDIPF